MEILSWNVENRAKFVTSMKEGRISVWSSRAMVIGCAGAGKTTLVKKLKGEDVEIDPGSTSGIEIHSHVFKLSPDESTITGKYPQNFILIYRPFKIEWSLE